MAADGYSRHRSPSLYSEEGVEEEELQPIYMRRLDVMQSYHGFEGDEDSYEEVSDDEEGLDLSAPPSES